MSGQHRATPEQWGPPPPDLRQLADQIQSLRARVEALEATQRTTAMDELRAASAEARPGGLVERVAETMATPSLPACEWKDEARAVIRAVAAWLRDRGGYPWAWVAQTLEMEADRG